MWNRGTAHWLSVAGVWSLACWIFRWFQGALLHQMMSPVYFKREADRLYWLFDDWGIAEWIISSPASGIVDAAWFVLSLGLVFWHRRWLAGLLLAVVLMYHVVFHGYFAHHGHTLIGLQLVLFLGALPMFSLKAKLGVMRLFVVFLYVSSGIWKLTRLGFWEPGHLQKIGIEQAQKWGGVASDIWQLEWLWDMAFPLVILFQLSFLVLLFTQKFDRWWLFAGVGFHLAIYLLMDIQFWELWIIYLPLAASSWLRLSDAVPDRTNGTMATP